ILCTFGISCSFPLPGCDSGPKNGKYWAEKLMDSPQERQQAVRELRKLKDPTALPGLLKALQHKNRYTGDVAYLVGELGDKSAVPALVAALDFDVISPTDTETKLRNQINGRIAAALGKLGEPAAVEPLRRLLATTDTSVQASTIRAIDRLQGSGAVEDLVQLVKTSGSNSNVKLAIVALGNLGATQAMPVLMRMLFFEREGASFYKETSYSIFQIGKEAVEPLIAACEGKVEEVNELKLDPAVVPAKVVLLLAEIGDQRCLPMLRKMAAFEDAASPLGFGPVVRGNAMRALALINDRELLPAMRKSLTDLDIGVRELPTEAVGLLGDRGALSDLLRAASHEPFWTDCKKAGYDDQACGNSEREVRLLSARWLTRLGDTSIVEAYKKMVDEEKNEAIRKALAEEMVRLDAAGQCAQNVDCWVKKLKEMPAANASEEEQARSARIRDKAAFELAYLANPAATQALLEAAVDPDVDVRYGVGMALLRMMPKTGAEELSRLVKKESSRSTYARVNELLKRIALKIQRGY
ncbi:MAG: HEAT repeat domain-containing protein, partial [Deltaproteobacteria bacterium]|nr:HEAT repeat domain-containing protein [Deltaproteobacteria bacterium]